MGEERDDETKGRRGRVNGTGECGGYERGGGGGWGEMEGEEYVKR